MNRRQLLRGLGISTLGLLALPPQAFAIGGTLPELDQAAPTFSLGGVAPDARGEAIESTLSLADFAGQWLVLYFYPRDFTEGCTIEARGFQRDLAAFRQAAPPGVAVSECKCLGKCKASPVADVHTRDVKTRHTRLHASEAAFVLAQSFRPHS